MVDVATILRRKSIKLKSKLKSCGHEHDNSLNGCISPSESVFSLELRQDSSDTLINTGSSKTSKYSLELLNGPRDVLNLGQGDIRRNRSFLSNTSCLAGASIPRLKNNKLYLGRQTGSGSDLVYQMNRTSWMLDESDAAGIVSNGKDTSTDRAAEMKNAHEAGHDNNGEVIFVPSLSPRGSNTTLSNLLYSYRSVSDIASLKRNQRHVSETRKQRSRSSSASSDSSSSYLEIPRKPVRIRNETQTVNIIPRKQSLSVTVIHFLIYTLNISLLIFVYMPIWIGVQVSKYTAWILAIGFAIGIFFGTWYLFIQVYTYLRYTIIQNVISLINP